MFILELTINTSNYCANTLLLTSDEFCSISTPKFPTNRQIEWLVTSVCILIEYGWNALIWLVPYHDHIFW